MGFELYSPLYMLHFYFTVLETPDREGMWMSKLLGIVLIFAAAWLMFKLQAEDGSGSGEEHERSVMELRNRQGGCEGSYPGESSREEDGVYAGSKSETDRQGNG